MPQRTALILVVGLTESLISDDCPRIRDYAKAGTLRQLKPVLPAVTTTVQSSMLTGTTPSEHGIVGNGWYNREMAEIQFWKQSNRLVQREKIWETLRQRDPSATTLNMFWWYNMYSTADWSVTPRPIYKADGRKIPDCYSNPASLRDELQAELGTFPLFNFWGPTASIKSSRWIADASMIAHKKYDPTLTLIYLPHLDYALQQVGPNHEKAREAVREIDVVVGDLLDYFNNRDVNVILASEYGIEEVDDAVHINRALREAGLITVREEKGLELLDAGASKAFAVADHQVAHVYFERTCSDAEKQHVAELCASLPGVEQVLDQAAQQNAGLAHARSGDLVLVSDARHWFSYDYWLDDSRAPDFARTVDIHRKPGYDPCELFLDPHLLSPKLRVMWRLFQKKILQQRALIDVIPLDTKLVRGSHGRVDQAKKLMPVLITSGAVKVESDADELPCTAVRDLVLESIFDTKS